MSMWVAPEIDHPVVEVEVLACWIGERNPIYTSKVDQNGKWHYLSGTRWRLAATWPSYWWSGTPRMLVGEV